VYEIIAPPGLLVSTGPNAQIVAEKIYITEKSWLDRDCPEGIREKFWDWAAKELGKLAIATIYGFSTLLD
jgi:hypothetical protein